MLGKIDAFVNDQEKVAKVIELIRNVSLTYPMNAGCLAPVLLLAAMCSAFYWAPFDWGVWSVISYLVVAIIVCGALFIFLNRRSAGAGSPTCSFRWPRSATWICRCSSAC